MSSYPLTITKPSLKWHNCPTISSKVLLNVPQFVPLLLSKTHVVVSFQYAVKKSFFFVCNQGTHKFPLLVLGWDSVSVMVLKWHNCLTISCKVLLNVPQFVPPLASFRYTAKIIFVIKEHISFLFSFWAGIQYQF